MPCPPHFRVTYLTSGSEPRALGPLSRDAGPVPLTRTQIRLCILEIYPSETNLAVTFCHISITRETNVSSRNDSESHWEVFSNQLTGCNLLIPLNFNFFKTSTDLTRDSTPNWVREMNSDGNPCDCHKLPGQYGLFLCTTLLALIRN